MKIIADIKKCIKTSINALFLFILTISIVNFFMLLDVRNKIQEEINENRITQKNIIEEIQTNRKKIHYRYFNLTNSLESIYDIKLNTYNGKIER